MVTAYSPKQFGQLIGRSVNTLFCARHGTEVLIVNGDTLSPEAELMQDLLAIVQVFGARLSGLRSYTKVIRDAALHKDQAPGE